MIIKKYTKLPEEAKKIRTEVFLDEQKFKVEFDDTDDIAVHVVMYDGDKAVAVCRYFYDESHGCYMIGRVAVVKEYRGRKLGAEIMLAAEKFIKEDGGKKIGLSAQCRASGFYETLGYRKQGEEYLDEYCPHILMTKDI